MNLIEKKYASRFGFLLTDGTLDQAAEASVKGWNRITLGRFQLTLHPECRLHVFAVRDGWCALLGEAFVALGRRSLECLLRAFCDEAEWDALDLIGGRHSLVVVQKERVWILHDAFGSRSVYYHVGEAVAVGSHPHLVAAAVGVGLDPEAEWFRDAPEYRQRGTRYLPGDRSMYHSIHALTPNHFYDSDTRSVHRFWPRAPAAMTREEDFFDVADEYFRNFAIFLQGRFVALLGLTGGVDGRALIAGLRHHGAACRLLTWDGGRLPEAERPIVEKMIAYLGEQHSFMDVSAPGKSNHFKARLVVSSEATGYSRGVSRLTANMGERARGHEVFIRGYGGEILRGFYNRQGHSGASMDAQTLFRLYLTKRVPEPSARFSRLGTEAFQSFIERTGFQDERFHGMDPLDLFYWEQRMGVWGALMLNEMDPAVYSMAGLNCRRLYQLAFGLPRASRLGSGLMLRLTARFDSGLAEIGALS